MNRAESYETGARLTFELVGRFKIFGSGRPEFAMPPRELALIASLADVGKQLARNDAARELLSQILKECDRRKLDDYPTVMMLRTALEHYGIPITWVAFEELGLKGTFTPMGRGGST